MAQAGLTPAPSAGGLTAAALAARGKVGGKLSSRLEALAHLPALRYAATQARARALSLPPSGPGSLIEDPQGRPLVYIRVADVGAPTLRSLRAAGAHIIYASASYREVTAYVDPAHLDQVAALAAVQNIREVPAPLHGGQGPGRTVKRSAPASPSLAYACPQGLAVSEGDTQLQAAQARAAYGLDGSGVKVGVLSDSFNTMTPTVDTAVQDIASGDLPGPGNPCGPRYQTPVQVIEEDPLPGTDEGRAMLQIVHDLAPGATLAFATAEEGIYDFANNILLLRLDGGDIIADDMTYFDEPFFQDGPVGVAISDVVSAGGVYFTAAANNNLIVDGDDVASYEAPAYRPDTTLPGFLSTSSGYDSCHNFNPSGTTNEAYTMTLSGGGQLSLDLQWAEPWYGVTTNLDVFLTDSQGKQILAEGNTIAAGDNGSQVPFQYFSYTNISAEPATVNLYVCRYSGSEGGDQTTPRFKWVLLENGLTPVLGVGYPTSAGGDIVGPTVFGHSATATGFSLAAVPYSENTTPEPYSSRGPAVHYFGPFNWAFTPAAPIQPVTITQPSFAATDGGCTTFFNFYYSENCYRFWGTSAAAPHAAGVAALLKQQAGLHPAFPWNSANVGWLLATTAQPMSGGDAGSVGAGMLDALAAAQEITRWQVLFLPVLMLNSP